MRRIIRITLHIRLLEQQEAGAYARQPQTEQELADVDAWQEIEAWDEQPGDYEH